MRAGKRKERRREEGGEKGGEGGANEDGRGGKPPIVTRESLLGEVVRNHPRAALFFLEYGLHCIGCRVSAYETVEEGCRAHGMPEAVINELLGEVNALLAEEAAGKEGEKKEEDL